MLKDKSFGSYSHVVTLKRSGRKQVITYFRDFFEPIYVLSGLEIDMAYGFPFYGRNCRPFEEFKNNKIRARFRFFSISSNCLPVAFRMLGFLTCFNITFSQDASVLLSQRLGT